MPDAAVAADVLPAAYRALRQGRNDACFPVGRDTGGGLDYQRWMCSPHRRTAVDGMPRELGWERVMAGS